MATALILSSLVAASRIGGGLQQVVLAADGIEPVLAPTIMLSRSAGTSAILPQMVNNADLTIPGSVLLTLSVSFQYR